MKKTITTIFLTTFFSLSQAQNTQDNLSVSTKMENGCSIYASDGAFLNLDYFSPTNTYNTHDHIRNTYAKTPISILCSPGTYFNFKGTPQNTSNKNGYMLQHTQDPRYYIVVNPYFDLSPRDSEPDYNKLFRGQNNRYVTASGQREDWSMYWFAFNYLTNRFPGLLAPIPGKYELNMSINLDF